MSATWLYAVFRASMVIAIACTVTCQQICSRKAYRYKGHCLPCPEHCRTCISSTNCTKCDDNNYGPFCQHACEDECTDQCHKEYGYCTYGCVDGRFPEKDSPRCPFCPSNCTLCKSSTECILCHPGYHGNICQYPCARQCDKCDQRTGNCLMCAEGYLKIDGCCRRCPDGLDDCHDNMICYGCKEGYLRLGDGECIMECPREESGLYKVSNSQDEFDISNDQIAQNECMDAGTSQSVSFKTTTPCIRVLPCPGGLDCSSEDTDTQTCAAIMKYECINNCQPLNESYHQCDQNCSTENRNQHILSFCLIGRFLVTNVSTQTDCLPASSGVDTGQCSQDCHVVVSVAVILAVMCILLLVLAGFTILYLRKRRVSIKWIELFPCTSMRNSTSGAETDTKLGKSVTTETVLTTTDSLEPEPSERIPMIQEGLPLMTWQEHTREPSKTLMPVGITDLNPDINTVEPRLSEAARTYEIQTVKEAFG